MKYKSNRLGLKIHKCKSCGRKVFGLMNGECSKCWKPSFMNKEKYKKNLF